MAVDQEPESSSAEDDYPRKASRVEVRFDAEYSGRSVQGTGVVLNISASGALIEDADPPLLSGGEVTLKFSLYEGSVALTVRAIVTRETDRGFGVKFIEMNPRTRKVLKMSIAKALRLAQGSSAAPGHLGSD